MSQWQYLGHVEPISTTRYAVVRQPESLLPETTSRFSLSVGILSAAICAFVPVVATAATPLGWDQGQSVPTHAVRLLTVETGGEQPVLFTGVSTLAGWASEFPPPTPPARLLTTETGAEQPVAFVRASEVSGWQSDLSVPQGQRTLLVGTGAENPVAFVRSSEVWGWLSDLPVPSAHPRLLHGTGADAPTFVPTAVPVQIAWHHDLSVPQPPAPLLTRTTGAERPTEWPAVAPFNVGWFHTLSVPSRARTHETYATGGEQPLANVTILVRRPVQRSAGARSSWRKMTVGN